MTNDAVPELILVDERSKRKTVELCVDERDGYQCVLVRGHEGMDEVVATVGSVRWENASDAKAH